MKKTIILTLFFILICGIPQFAGNFFLSVQGWKNNLNAHQFNGTFSLALPAEYASPATLRENYSMENYVSISVAAGRVFEIGRLEISAGIFAEISSSDVTGTGIIAIPNPFSQSGSRDLNITMESLKMKKNFFGFRISAKIIQSGFYQNQLGVDIGVMSGSVDLLEGVSVTETLENATFVPVLDSTRTKTTNFSQLGFGIKMNNFFKLHDMIQLLLGLGYDHSPAVELSNSQNEIISINLNAFKFGAGIYLKF